MKHTVHSVIILLILCVFFSCDYGKPASQDASDASRSAPVSTPAQSVAADANHGIRILPESPTPETDLQVITTDLPDAAFAWEKNGSIIQGENSTQLSKSFFGKGDRITVTARSGSRELSASVEIGNTPPVITGVTVTPQGIYHGIDMTVTPTGFDADGDYVKFFYTWYVNGQEAGEHTSILKGSQFKKGDQVSVVIVPSDTDGDGQSYKSAPLIIPNAPPRFTSVPVEQRMDGLYEYNVHAEDADGDRVTYALSAAPDGMTIDANTGKVTWKIKKEDAGNHAIEIQAQDDAGLIVIQKFTLTIED